MIKKQKVRDTMPKGLFAINEDSKKSDDRYTNKVMAPQYVPKNEKPPVEGLCNIEKYSKLIRAINESNVSEEEKKFLKFAASRHIVFNYSLIADYYAHTSAEMQDLMEQSALVILDIDDAIANGYVKLSKQLDKLLDDGDNSRRIN